MNTSERPKATRGSVGVSRVKPWASKRTYRMRKSLELWRGVNGIGSLVFGSVTRNGMKDRRVVRQSSLPERENL